MYCMKCGIPLDLLITKEEIKLRTIPVWLGCETCQTVYFCGKYSPISKTGRIIRELKIKYSKFKKKLKTGWIPDEPKIAGYNVPLKRLKP